MKLARVISRFVNIDKTIKQLEAEKNTDNYIEYMPGTYGEALVELSCRMAELKLEIFKAFVGR